MLEHIAIRNLALIEDMQIDFDRGFTVLSGETGAGKSIILGALNLLLGDKADGSLVRSGADEASIYAVVSIAEDHPLNDWLRERDVDPEDGSLVIRRVVRQSGRGTIHVQSTPMTRGDLAHISDLLFDMHGQHEHQSLLSSDRQRKVLDAFGAYSSDIAAYGQAYRELERMQQQYREQESVLSQALREVDYLSFVVEELDRAKLERQEDERLEEELSILSQFETIHDNLELVQQQLRSTTDQGALSSLSLAVQSIRKAAKADASLDELSVRLETILLETQDIAETVRDRLSSMSFSQARLDDLQGRSAQLQRLKKKYGPTLDEVIAFHETAKKRLDTTSESDQLLEELKSQIAQQEALTGRLGDRLRARRLAAAEVLQQQIAARLEHLGMPHVVFTIEITDRPRSIHGTDQVDFWFSANLGEPKRSLKEIASGGELSRVMLAVKTVLAEADEVETLVFDEVDAGIGGAVAIAVGEQMAELAQTRQVIAITHLASIAAKAQHHLVVHKEAEGGRTYTRINSVSGESRIAEIARMLSGHRNDERAVAHARSLISE